MATMYARSVLTNWNNTGSSGSGWSNTSGGAGNGTSPTSSTDVIFDGNSGTARAITVTDGLSSGSVPFKSITTSAANAMTFSGAAFQANAGGAVDFTGSACSNAIQFVGGVSANFNSGSSTFTSFMSLATPVVLTADLTLSGALILDTTANFNANNFNVTATNLSLSGTLTLTMGSGTWTMTASNGDAWNVAGGATVTAGTSTIKLTGGSSSTKNFVGVGKTYNNFWNATTGSGVCAMTGSNTFNNFKLDAGRTQTLGASSVVTVTSMTADGTGGQITLSSDTGAASVSLVKAGGGTIYVDRCTIQDIHATPSTTWYARNSTNTSGNTGITFIPGNSAFMQFF